MDYSVIVPETFVGRIKALSKARPWSKLRSIFRTRRKYDVFSLLPNVIVEEILYRVPADTVLGCKRVCKNWYDIITSDHFARAHLKRANAVNLSVFLHRDDRSFFAMERDTKGMIRSERVDIIEPGFNSNSNVLRLRWLTVIQSCKGLLLLKYHTAGALGPLFAICNPITREFVPFTPTTERRMIVGFFYDEVTSEYKALLFRKYDRNNFTYYVYGWRSKVEKILCTNRLYPSQRYDNTTIVAGRLVCWRVCNEYDDASCVSHCSESIMMFKMDDETLHCTPHPETMNCKWDPSTITLNPHENMRLLDLDGNLGVAFSFATIITIWCLEDSLNFTWVVRHEIDFGPELEKYPVVPYHIPYDEYLTMDVLNLSDGHLFFLLISKGLFSQNLRSKTLNKLKINAVTAGFPDIRCLSVLHLKSLISPKEVLG